MKKARRLGIVLVAMLTVSGVAKGMVITKVEIAQAIPVTLSYATGTGVLTYDESTGAQAQVTFDDLSTEIFTSVDIMSLHNLTLDTSDGGEASGSFLTGAISVNLSAPLGTNPGSDVTSIILGGTMDWFNLQANNGLPNTTMNGEGIFTLNSNTVISPGMGIVWGALGGKSAVSTTHQSLSPSHPADLGGDISGTSGSLTVFATHPIIPEPVSVALLGLGGISVLRRRLVRS